MKLLSLAAAFFLTAGSIVSDPTPVNRTPMDVAHKSMYRVDIADGSCTASAVGPHAILTAEHCGTASEIQIGKRKVKVLKVLLDGHDHEVLLLSGIDFKTYINFKIDNPRLAQCEHVYMFGNPLAMDDMEDQFREGYVSGQHAINDKVADMIVMPAIPGDSGSAIFDTEGRLVGVLAGHGDAFAYSYPLVFTQQQVSEATTF